MVRKAVIGIIPLYDDEKESVWMLPAYMDGLANAGALPIMLPLHMAEEDIDTINSICDGYLFTGGHDVNPALYGEENRGKCGTINGDRDFLEKIIFNRAYRDNKPVLGICRGLQIVNVLMGGTLYQDLPTENPTDTNHHMKPPYDIAAHNVSIEEDSSLYKLLKKPQIGVNSYHHQAIKDIAPGLKIMARAEDGTVEAIEDTSRKFLWAVQWHPEYSYKKDENSRKILRAFAAACQ